MATQNPYDISAPVPTAATLANAQNATADITPAAVNAPRIGTYAPYDPATRTAATATSASFDPSQATRTNWDVGTDQTVEGRLAGLISANSPLLEQARTRALEQANSRGLLNSSMGVGLGEQAVMSQALPIAQADAAMFGNAAKYNADSANQMSQFNTTARNNAAQFNAGAQQQVNLANQAATNDAASANQTAVNSAGQFNAQNSLQSSQFNAQQTNAVNEANAARSQQAELANMDAANKLVAQQMDNSFKAAIASADNQNRANIAILENTTKVDLANIEAQFKQVMQTTDSASNLYQQALKNIADIMSNPDIKDATAAVQRQKDALRNGLAILDAMNTSVSGLDNLLTFSVPDAPPPAPAPPPATPDFGSDPGYNQSAG